MKVLHCLAAIAVVCLSAGVASADTIDFHIGVLDPPFPGYSVEDSTPFDVTFGGCPTSISGDGCFGIYNDTKTTIASLELTFANSESATDPTDFVNYLNGQTPDCSIGSGSLFSGDSCSLVDDKTYVLDLFGAPGIAPGQTGFIVETGPTPAAFGTGKGVVSFVPEPGSLVLLSTGAMMMGLFLTRQRG